MREICKSGSVRGCKTEPLTQTKNWVKERSEVEKVYSTGTMWENAAPQSESQKPPPPRPACENGGDTLLWGQMLFCTVVLLVALAARMMGLPFYPELRRTFAQAMQPEQDFFLSTERYFSKFTEKAAAAIAQALPATSETARQPRRKPQPPANACEESYTPNFPLLFPLPCGSCTRTSGYGWRTDPMGGGGTDFHLGHDLAAATGTPVLAAADGVVRVAGKHASYGNYLRILHADGDETLYAHMQYLFVSTGTVVTAGQVLGVVGETGNATGPHLHFEILHKGLRYDPAQALQDAA